MSQIAHDSISCAHAPLGRQAARTRSLSAAQTSFTARTDRLDLRGEAGGNGWNPYENVIGPANVNRLQLAWTTAGSWFANIPPGVVVASKTIVALEPHLNTLVAVNTEGKQVWSQTLASSFFSGPAPADGSGVLVAASTDGPLEGPRGSVPPAGRRPWHVRRWHAWRRGHALGSTGRGVQSLRPPGPAPPCERAVRATCARGRPCDGARRRVPARGPGVPPCFPPRAPELQRAPRSREGSARNARGSVGGCCPRERAPAAGCCRSGPRERRRGATRAGWRASDSRGASWCGGRASGWSSPRLAWLAYRKPRRSGVSLSRPVSRILS